MTPLRNFGGGWRASSLLRAPRWSLALVHLLAHRAFPSRAAMAMSADNLICAIHGRELRLFAVAIDNAAQTLLATQPLDHVGAKGCRDGPFRSSRPERSAVLF